MVLILTSLVALLGLCLGDPSPPVPILSSGTVIGTVITACDNVTFHTPPGDPYPTRSGKHLWLTDSHTPCLVDSITALDYCRKVYPDQHIDHVVVDPFKIVPGILPWFPPNASSSIRVYLCLGPPPTNLNDAQLTAKPLVPTTAKTPVTNPPLPDQHRLPNLIDVHRAYFAEQFRHLWNRTHSNVSQIVSHLVQETKGLFKLYPSNPQLVQYAVSQMLQKAHERLQSIWATEEHEWSELEQREHEDLASQLGSDEWAGENMFAFALQESHPDVGRVQDALSVLLSRLSVSVSEEVRHLKSVHNRQPWMLRLDAPTNWTANVTHGVTSLEQVHQALLKHVRVATLAINAFHSIMARYIKAHPAARLSYKPTLVTSYDRLQANLFEAQRLLNQAKSTLLGNLSTRMSSILTHLNNTLNQQNPQSVTNISLSDWIKSKHHAELAYIDLLVAQLLTPYVASIDLPIDKDKSEFVWQPVAHPFEQRTTEALTVNTVWSRDHLFITVTVILCSISLLSTFLFCFIRLLRSTTSRSIGEAERRRSRFRSLMSRGGHKLKYLISKSQQQWIPGTSSIWKVGPRIVVVATDQVACHPVNDLQSNGNEVKIHGYTNPVCPIQRG